MIDAALTLLVSELDRLHPGGVLDTRNLDRDRLPTILTGENDEQRVLSGKAIDQLRIISAHWYAGGQWNATLRLEEFTRLLTQSVVDSHTADELAAATVDVATMKRTLRARLETAIQALHTRFTHSYPAWTLGIEQRRTFAVGAVQFMSREDWLAAVTIPPAHVKMFSPRKGRIVDWKARVLARLAGARPRGRRSYLPDGIADALLDCPSVLRVEVVGSEIALSKQRAHFVCNVALNAIGLLVYDDGRVFRQLALHDARLVPTRIFTLVEKDGFLALPGHRNELRGWLGHPDRVDAELKHWGNDLLAAVGKVIAALLDPTSATSPGLAQRWATALSVFVEGCRESHDGLATSKLVASLDMLTDGGKEKGIRELISHLLGIQTSAIVVTLPTPLTLQQVVEHIFKRGRSQFLHGNRIDPMERFADERSYSTWFARMALIETVLRWAHYVGPDDRKAFVTMAPAPPPSPSPAPADHDDTSS